MTTKIGETEKTMLDHKHDKYITTEEFNKLTADNFAARIKEAKLVTKTDIADFPQKTDLNDKLNI